jgi:hypothetical protein
MRVCYASYVVMRVRRETDEQGNTVNLNQLLEEIETRSDVITRARYFEMLDLPSGHHMLQPNETYFTDTWTRPSTRPNPTDPGEDYVHGYQVKDDRQTVTRRGDDAIEGTLKKYYTLLHGVTLMQAEPAPQFNTHEVFTFPWLETGHCRKFAYVAG